MMAKNIRQNFRQLQNAYHIFRLYENKFDIKQNSRQLRNGARRLCYKRMLLKPFVMLHTTLS
jgi:uncharacterized membrane protein YjjP (DUF1212 family)